MTQPPTKQSVTDVVARAAAALKRGRERHVAGAFSEAAAYFREASTLRESVFGAADARTLEAVRHEAAALAALGQLESAADLQFRALEGSVESASRSRSRLADDAAALARLRARQREWNDAARLWLVVLRERRATLGAHHTDTLNALAQLANSWQSGEHPQRAERAWRRLLAAREATGASAVDLAAVRERIADCLAASDRRGEALAERLRAMSERSPAPADATRVPMPPAATRDAAAKSSQSAQPDASRDVSPKAPGATDSAPAAQSPPPLALRIFALAGAANSGIRSTLSGLLPKAPAARAAGATGSAGQAGNDTSGKVGEQRARYPGGRSATDAPSRRRKFGMLALLAVLIVCFIAIVRYEMARAEQQESFEAERREYLAPPPSDEPAEEDDSRNDDNAASLGAPSTEVYRPR